MACVKWAVVVKVGVTGHQSLPNPRVWTWVRTEFRSNLQRLNGDLVGVTSLAEGADQVFAEVVVSLGGSIWAVVPFPAYETRFSSANARVAYERHLKAAARVDVLPTPPSDEVGYMRASERMIELADLLFAVWNGLPARGYGGTADVVARALAVGVPVVRLNPTSLTVAEIGGTASADKTT